MRYCWLVFHACILLCWATEALCMCSFKERLPSEDEWLGCVPCPPPTQFSLLCSSDYKKCFNCSNLSKLLEVCLSQYDRYYPQSFSQDINLKCTQKEACFKQRPYCEPHTRSVFRNIGASCRQTTVHIQSTTPYFTRSTTPYFTRSTSTRSTTHKSTTQTIEVHVTTQVATFTSTVAVDNDTVLTTDNTHNVEETPTTKVQSSSSDTAIISIIFSILLLLIAFMLFVVWRMRRRFSVTVRTPLHRQTSTDSRAPIIRTDNGYSILCLNLKRKMTSQDTDVFPTKETPRGYYEPVPLGADSEPNVLGADSAPITVGADYELNLLGADSATIPLGVNNEPIPIGANYESNSLGGNHEPNLLGADYEPNLLGTDSAHISIGADYESNPLGGSNEPNLLGGNYEPTCDSLGGNSASNPLSGDYESNPSGGKESVVQEGRGALEVDCFASSVEDDVMKHGAKESCV